jgi:hypothetical protein
MMAFYHGGDIITYAVHALVWDLIRESVHALTRGMGPVVLIVITITAIGVIWLFNRRRA